MQIPESERLFFRRLTKEDFPALCKILQDDEVMYAYEGKFSDEEVTQWLDRQLWRYENENGHGLYAVILKENGELIGQCGLTLQDCKEQRVLEIGYLFQKKYWHKGYATEAAKAWKKYAFEQLGVNEVYSIIRDTNTASQKVAERNGMIKYDSFVKHYRGVDMPHYVYRAVKGIYTNGKTALNFISISETEMSDGMRNMSKVPLTDEEIEKLKEEIKRIGADESVFIFNDEGHLGNTCYNCDIDKVYVSRNIFPDTKYCSINLRDIMSAAAVLAHEYYGHRSYRDEYLNDLKTGVRSIPLWEAECRASITAAKITPNLTLKERRDLILDAFFHADEAEQVIELDNFMKEIVYGYKCPNDEKHITMPIPGIVYVSKASLEAVLGQQQGQ